MSYGLSVVSLSWPLILFIETGWLSVLGILTLVFSHSQAVTASVSFASFFAKIEVDANYNYNYRLFENRYTIFKVPKWWWYKQTKQTKKNQLILHLKYSYFDLSSFLEMLKTNLKFTLVHGVTYPLYGSLRRWMCNVLLKSYELCPNTYKEMLR